RSDDEREETGGERAEAPGLLAAPALHGVPPFGTSGPIPPGESVNVSPSGTRLGPRPTPRPFLSSWRYVGPSGPSLGKPSTVARRYGSPATDLSRYGLPAIV